MKLSWCRINIDFLSINRQINIEHLCTISLWPLTDKTKTKVFIDPYDMCHCASVAKFCSQPQQLHCFTLPPPA